MERFVCGSLQTKSDKHAKNYGIRLDRDSFIVTGWNVMALFMDSIVDSLFAWTLKMGESFGKVGNIPTPMPSELAICYCCYEAMVC